MQIIKSSEPIAFIPFDDLFSSGILNSIGQRGDFQISVLYNKEDNRYYPKYEFKQTFDSEKFEEKIVDLPITYDYRHFVGNWRSWYLPIYQPDMYNRGIDTIAHRGEIIVDKVGQFVRKHRAELSNIIAFAMNNYNPLDNYDRHEIFDETNKTDYEGSETDTLTKYGKEFNKETRGGYEQTTTTPTGKEKDTTTTSEIGMNTNDFANGKKEQVETETTYLENRKDTTKREVSNDWKDEFETSFQNRSDENVKEFVNRSDTTTHKGNNHLYGNIGVTQTTEMALNQLKISQVYNITEYIYTRFANEYCIVM